MFYLLMVSLFLHLISFFALLVLYKRQEAYRPENDNKNIKEMEDMLLSYTTEMKDNNERLIRRLKEEKASYIKSGINSAEEETEKQTGPPAPKENLPDSTQHPETNKEQALYDKYENYEPPLPDLEKPPLVETTLRSQVLALKEKGYSENEIAQQLKIGAGEVELLIKFYQ
ncbi:DUF6115 domain-containing protein [Alkalicoccus daliensis]|uniref:Coupling factor for flagellin transcription and translation n=1 Tax=Alkalicoccus daliensis TaxID=745820 RepID=A0A1H0A5I6_9BACI|nr:hypothetical protein [Alkalicoccus daliensis]SDN28929.1 hypothetical protein SAMN04488053_101365 [Alkalicoccus daliensis]